MVINSKKKGNLWENRWANWLKDNGIKAWKDGGSGGGNREKADVGNNINANFEVKGVKKLNLQKAWQQSEMASLQTRTTPYVIIHFDGMAQDDFLVVIKNHDWLELIKGEKEIKTDYQDSGKKFRLQRLIETAKLVIKDFE